LSHGARGCGGIGRSQARVRLVVGEWIEPEAAATPVVVPVILNEFESKGADAMAGITVGMGAVLVLLGLIGFFGTGASHPTALIPSGFGAVFLLLGIAARGERFRMHLMHVAVILAVLGFLGTVGGLVSLPALLAGEAERPAAVLSQATMAALCLVYVVLAVKSFVDARRNRSDDTAAGEQDSASQ
jgi:hypothetical protein